MKCAVSLIFKSVTVAITTTIPKFTAPGDNGVEVPLLLVIKAGARFMGQLTGILLYGNVFLSTGDGIRRSGGLVRPSDRQGRRGGDREERKPGGGGSGSGGGCGSGGDVKINDWWGGSVLVLSSLSIFPFSIVLAILAFLVLARFLCIVSPVI